MILEEVCDAGKFVFSEVIDVVKKQREQHSREGSVSL